MTDVKPQYSPVPVRAMADRDLIGAWLRLPSVPIEMLRRHGIPYRASQLVGGVRQGRDGRLLIPVWDDPPSIYNSVEDPVLLAIVATDPAQPAAWTLHPESDDAVMLGEAALREARYYGDPLRVFRTPLSWLRSGGAGVFPLDWRRFAQEMLWRPEIELAAETVELGNKLKREIDKAARTRKPRISVEMKAA